MGKLLRIDELDLNILGPLILKISWVDGTMWFSVSATTSVKSELEDTIDWVLVFIVIFLGTGSYEESLSF